MAAADLHDGSHSAVGPRVFMSYTHDDEWHKGHVHAFARSLTVRAFGSNSTSGTPMPAGTGWPGPPTASPPATTFWSSPLQVIRE